MASINMVACDSDAVSDWEFGDSTGGPDISSQGGIDVDFGGLDEACSEVNEYSPSFASDLLSSAAYVMDWKR